MQTPRTHDPVDAAYRDFERLAKDIEAYASTICTEEDTRVKVVDRMFSEVLGWSLGDIQTEQHSAGDYLDYRLNVAGFARAIVEAKRDGTALGLTRRHSGESYLLSGPVFQAKAVKEGLKQAAGYCGQKNAELACLTNGREWIIFRGSRLGDGKDTFEGKAFVFSSLDGIRTRFRDFYDLLSRQAVESFSYRAIFQEAEGIKVRSHTFRRALTGPSDCVAIRGDGLSVDIDRVMSSFFRRLSGDADPDLLAQCFVTTAESDHADLRLAHIADELIASVRSLSTAGQDRLSEIIDRVKKTQRNAFVLLVGGKGAGKSTFIDRFFKMMLRPSLAADCVLVRVNLADSPGSPDGVPKWLDKHLLEHIEAALFSKGVPTYDELQGTFYDEYSRRKTGAMKHLYDSDKIAFKIDFGNYIESYRKDRPHDYIMRLVASIARARNKVACIVFDNADHFTVEFQEAVFRYARSIYEREISLIIVPVTDQTTWHLARSSERTLKSFESETLFLPTPSPTRVLEKRIAFVESRASKEKGKPGEGYFFGRGISLSIENLQAFAATLQKVFLQTEQTSEWVADLANWNIRQCLELAKEIVASPHLRVSELLAAYISGTALPVTRDDVKRAILRGKYSQYYVGHHSWIHNLYDFEPSVETSPLLPLRVLTMLHDAQRDYDGHRYVSVDQVFDYFSAMGMDSRSVAPIVQKLLKSELCIGYDPTVIELAKSSRIELNPSGDRHRRMALSDWAYMDAMCQVTQIRDKDVFAEISGYYACGKSGRRKTIERFVRYLCEEDARYGVIPQHTAYESQFKLASTFTRAMLWRDRSEAV